MFTIKTSFTYTHTCINAYTNKHIHRDWKSSNLRTFIYQCYCIYMRQVNRKLSIKLPPQGPMASYPYEKFTRTSLLKIVLKMGISQLFSHKIQVTEIRKIGQDTEKQGTKIFGWANDVFIDMCMWLVCMLHALLCRMHCKMMHAI